MTTAKSKARVSFANHSIDGVKLPGVTALSDSYIDGNLDWSFCKLTPQMAKLVVNDWMTYMKRKSDDEGSTKNRTRKFSWTLKRLTGGSKTLRKRISHTPSASILEMTLKTVHNWDFDIFYVNQVIGRHTMLPVAKSIFIHHDLLNKFHIPDIVFDEFVLKVERHYKQNPFHNAVHATDVMQTAHSIMIQSGFVKRMNNLEILCVLITALCHDIEHTGTNNSFHRNTCSELAKLYVVSILENHHLRVALAILQQVKLLASLTDTEFEEFKDMLCSMILSTDMSNHFQLITNMKIILHTPSKCSSRLRIRRIMLLLLHTADISNPAKPWDIHKIWVSLLCQEFFEQGEREKKLNLPVSPYCDRHTVNIAAVQLGFMQTFTAESFEVLYTLLENDLAENGGALSLDQQPWQSCLNENVESWSKNWSSLKFAFINDLLDETVNPRKSVIGDLLKRMT